MKVKEYDFSGWATKNNVKCSDGRVIMKDAFAHLDGVQVPLVWHHNRSTPDNILGHAILENRPEGVYCWAKFNDTESGLVAKKLVMHGDINALSIFANQLVQKGPNVQHGRIQEVSLVIAGANDEALIDNVVMHGYETPDEAVIFTGETIWLQHEEIVHESIDTPNDEEEPVVDLEVEHADGVNTPEEKEETIADIIDTMSEKQKTVLYALVGQAVEDANNKDPEGGEEMKHNLFEGEVGDENKTLSHADMATILADAKKGAGTSLRQVFEEFVESNELAHGITNVDFLFPDAKTIDNIPSFIQREMGWVSDVMGRVHHTPFSRIKSIFADITEDEARAKGYIKGNLKKEEVFSLLKRTTSPTTIYKKQKMDRDDVIDITDFDVVAWLKAEMRMMLDEEIARAILVGDGRLVDSDDKIKEDCIRPIWKDADLYTIKTNVPVPAAATDADKARAFIKGVIKSRKNYKGSGNPVLYTTEDLVTDCLLLEDTTGRFIYDSVEKLAQVLRVSKIVTVPVMEGLSRVADTVTYTLMGIVVNLSDYNVGADKGGAVNMFDDFDIDYNAQKYLIETRCSGALIKPHSAIAVEMTVQAAG